MSNHPSTVDALAHQAKIIASGAVAAIALALAFAAAPAPAFAVDAAGAYDQGSPCVPTEEQIEAYRADGSLDERVQTAERLGHEQPSVGLTQQALARQAAVLGSDAGASPMRSAVPSVWRSGMATVGAGRVLALRVSFPDYSFADDDSLEALDALFNGDDRSGFPYESLHAYYERASYGKLDISGTAVDYQAKHERSYYQGDINTLFVEALDALDETLDLSQFDANDDGYLDCVYIHFAGPDSGWGSTWWSQEWTVQQQASPEVCERSWDGRRLWNACLLAENCAGDMAASTLIHETGHVLGLPDLYSYRRASADAAERSGCLTFDLMDNNTGDTNAFFKWMLGWVDEGKVVRVVANADGVDVLRDGALEHYDEHSLDQVLSAFTGSDLQECGGFIAVSDSEDLLDLGKGLFSSYYLLQYDRYAGNQSVVYKRGGQDVPLPSGFRLFRVQAALSQDGDDYLYKNTTGMPGNQLIELVDPDMDEPHTSGIGYAPAAVTGTGYGCMLRDGQEVSPTTYPSTNFGESIGGGFTGLAFSVGECDEGSGAVAVSWSDAAKPVPLEFSLSLKPTTLLNWGPVCFTMSYPALCKAYETGAFPYLEIDGKRVLSVTDASGETVTMDYKLNPGEVSPISACEAVFPAGCFLLGVVDGQEVYSEEIRVPFSPSGLAGFGAHGFYELETDPVVENVGKSSVFARGDGSHCFMRAVGEDLYLETFDEDDPSKVDEAMIEGAVLPTYPLTSTVLRCAMLPDDRCLVTASFEYGEASGLARAYLVDLGTRQVIHEASLSRYTGLFRAMAVGGAPVVGSYAYQFGLGDGYVLASAFAGADAGAQAAGDAASYDEGMLWTRAGNVYDAGNGLIAAVFSDNGPDNPDGPSHTIRLYDEEAVEECLAAAPAEMDSDTVEDFTESLEPVCTCELGGYQVICDVEAREDSVYVLASGRVDVDGDQDNALREGAVMRFDLAGKQIACRALVPVSSFASTYTDLVIGEQGAVAATRIAIGEKGAFEPQETHLFDSSLNDAGSYDFVGNSTGGWVGGRWVALGWDSSRFGNPTAAGAPPVGGVAQAKAAAAPFGAGGLADGAGEQVPIEPSDEHIRVGYAVTGVLDVDSGSGSKDPGDRHDPEPPGPKDHGDSKDPVDSDDLRKPGDFSPETGDDAPVIPLAVAAVAALVAAIAAYRCSR